MAEASAKGYVLISGGLDSQLAVCVLREAGAYVEGLVFETPFFSTDRARKAAAALNLKLTVVDFTADEIALIKDPPHGFGGAMNPCIDCHATMIRRAGELMRKNGFDFVATGEVLNQRPMSQNKVSLGVVAKTSGLAGRLVRPLSAQLLEPTVPEEEGKLDRAKLLSLQGRRRETQFRLADKYGLKDYPSPAGGCKLTETNYAARLRDLMEHEGLDYLRLVRLLAAGRRFRLKDGASVILGRNQDDNILLEKTVAANEMLVAPSNVSGPTALIVGNVSEADFKDACAIVAAWSKPPQDGGAVVLEVLSQEGDGMFEVPQPYRREDYTQYQIL
ncbi:MAG: hypothetical protein IJ802_07100 [Kiritimatiellae bacterium]|nr:hypothetical protein [Kiritimatiellia bacterium]